MLIIGAKGFAREVLEILYQLKMLENVAFFDDVSNDLPQKLYRQFDILRNVEEVKYYLKTVGNQFTLGIGNPLLRRKMCDKFESLGAVLTSTISPKANIGHFGNEIEEGCNIMTGTTITNDVIVRKGCLINLNCSIGHNCKIREYVEISPGVNISGHCSISEYTSIGTNATILPEINVGTNVVIAAGAVVTKDIPDNCLVAGVPAVIKKELPQIHF